MTEMTPQERAKDKRLWKAYRWTWAMYQALGTLQGWKCAICGRIATGGHSTLNLDHEHFKIYTRRLTLLDADDATIILGGLNLRWLAGTTVQGQVLVRYAKTKTAASIFERRRSSFICPWITVPRQTRQSWTRLLQSFTRQSRQPRLA